MSWRWASKWSSCAETLSLPAGSFLRITSFPPSVCCADTLCRLLERPICFIAVKHLAYLDHYTSSSVNPYRMITLAVASILLLSQRVVADILLVWQSPNGSKWTVGGLDECFRNLIRLQPPMQCSLENLGISWISNAPNLWMKHVSNLRYTEFLAAVPWNAHNWEGSWREFTLQHCSGKSSYL